MSVILIFVAFVLVGDTAAVFISYLFERISNFTSLMVFFGLFALVFYVAWKLAVLRDRALPRSPDLIPGANRFQSNVNVGCVVNAA